jgi:hypothetical protein
MYGREYGLASRGEQWLVELPGASAAYDGDHYIGGAPVIVVEELR